jgi:hypothetical protein
MVDGTPEIHPLAGDTNNHRSLGRGRRRRNRRAITGPNFCTQLPGVSVSLAAATFLPNVVVAAG